MAVVKLPNKNELDKLVAKITIRTGKKPTQQDVLEMCVNLGQEHFEELVNKILDVPKLDKAKIEKIIEMRKKLENIKFKRIEKENFASPDDFEIYSV